MLGGQERMMPIKIHKELYRAVFKRKAVEQVEKTLQPHKDVHLWMLFKLSSSSVMATWYPRK